ncbi:uncharacterized protein HKW66_Vig0153280 [Vigna angularis]|uniref:3'-5' exonuclease domain-containing protein n=1 Tax=Phaseolus angularis TaxID=3914 RepID=A0A8T0JKR1_PHAAN|nr:uncharacterized protein HKW66_Vig0153280 [Vigna angularis]
MVRFESSIEAIILMFKKIRRYKVCHCSLLFFLESSPQSKLVIGFDYEGFDLCRRGTLCTLLAFPDVVYLVDAIERGEELIKACKPALESSYTQK